MSDAQSPPSMKIKAEAGSSSTKSPQKLSPKADDNALVVDCEDLRTPTPPPSRRSNVSSSSRVGVLAHPRSADRSVRDPDSSSASGKGKGKSPANRQPTSSTSAMAGPSRSSGASSTTSNLTEQSSKSLNQMLMANLQRKDQVNEQLIQLMEGNAPPGTDPEWLKSSKAFLSTRIDEIRSILATRGSPAFSQSQAQTRTPSRRTPKATTSPHRLASPPDAGVAAVSRALSVSPIVVTTSSIKAFSDDEEDDQRALASPSPSPRPRQQPSPPPAGLVSPTLHRVRNQTSTVQSKSVAPAPPLQRRKAPPQTPSVRPAHRVSQHLASEQDVPVSSHDEFASLDPSIFDVDEDEQMLLAEIGGDAVNSVADAQTVKINQAQRTPVQPLSASSKPGTDLASTSRTTPVTNSKQPSLRSQMNYVWSRDVAKALRRTFGLQEFRNNQLEAINATLNGEDVFCLMPTGGGKSLCYQLPALIDSGRTQGVTIVISPLLSLIHDQVRHLLDLTIPALMLTGDMQGPKRDFALSELFSKTPTTRLLYLTPEFVGRSRQASDIFVHLHRNNLLARFVIDEAHCVSQWGHDFRPDYQTLGKLREQFPQIPVMAMTATANSRVKTDVISSLGIKGCKVLAQSFNRANLRYEVREKSPKTVIADIANFIQATHNGSCGIVYCLSRRTCEEVAEKLTREHGLQAQHYHAALSKTDRLAIQEAWQAGKFRIIVATIAFGMGIDKGDVRFVVHHTIPQSLEGYYQETGRAGRDGKSSSCALFFNYRDTVQIKRMIDDGEGTGDQKEQQHANLRRVVQYCMNKHDCRRSQVLQYFGEVFPAEACHHTCDNCLNSAANHRKAVEQDLTAIAKQAVQLVSDLSGRQKSAGFTMLHFVDVFRGSQSRAIRDRGHHNHRLNGAGSSLNRGDVERLFQDLTVRGVFHERSEVNTMGFAHAYLELGPEAQTLLNGNLRISMSVQRPAAGGAASGNGNASSDKNQQRNKNKRPVTARRGEGLSDGEFESFDAFDISNVDLSPDRAGSERGSSSGNRRSGTLMRTNSFDVGQAIITGNRSNKVDSSRSLNALARRNAASAAHAAGPVAVYDVDDDEDDCQQIGASSTSSRAAVLASGRKQSGQSRSSGTDLTLECLQELTKLRDELAKRNQCIKAGIFDNATLQRMAEQMPENIGRFVTIHGVGDDKYESFGREFLSVCKTYAARRGAGLQQFAFNGVRSPNVGGNLAQRSPSYMQASGHNRASVVSRESAGHDARKKARMSDGSVVSVTGSAPRSGRRSMI